MNIYLVGYMGSGKSTIGKLLAHRLNFAQLDLDDYFEETYKISVMNFFAKYDEAAFRGIETKLLEQTFGLENYVISTGGGTPCFNNNMELINENGVSVYIRMHPKSLFTRLKNAKRPRPRTFLLDDESLISRIDEDMLVREKFYKQASIEIKGENADINTLVELVSKYLSTS